MSDPRKDVFDAVREAAPPGVFNKPENITALDKLLDSFKVPRAGGVTGKITPRILMEIVKHEGIVLEAYRDTVGVWTWGVGVTNASGHEVFPRYKDNPQTLEKALRVSAQLLRDRYLPPVLKAFKGLPLTENQLGAALSFHYNTGAIGRATWVKDVVAGNMGAARENIMNWSKPPEIKSRRRAERDLFFDGKWTGDGKAPVYKVSKPSYLPKGSTNTDIREAAERALA